MVVPENTITINVYNTCASSSITKKEVPHGHARSIHIHIYIFRYNTLTLAMAPTSGLLLYHLLIDIHTHNFSKLPPPSPNQRWFSGQPHMS
jgi:hypothetical protein